MRKKGYTLVEVLVTLGIVGVVAILCVPMAVHNVNVKRDSATLGRVVSQIQTGNQNIIQRANSNSGNGEIVEVLALVTEDDVLSNNGERNILDIGVLQDIIPTFWGASTLQDNVMTILNTRATVTLQGGLDNNFVNGLNANLGNRATGYSLLIDVNGLKAPDTMGRDQFLFELMNDGTLNPSNAETRAVVQNNFSINN